MFGWPFTEEPWAKPDYDTVDLSSLARPEHFAGAAALGFEVWTHTPVLASIARKAGVECRLVGRGVPDPFAPPLLPRERDIDVLMLERSHWPASSRRVAERISGVMTLPVGAQSEVLATLGRTRVFVQPARIEANSRIGTEARAMGAVPVMLASNPLAALDERHGAVLAAALDEMPAVVGALLEDPERLGALSSRGIRTAREEVRWEPYVERVDELLSQGAPRDPGRGARAGLGAALRSGEGSGSEEVLAATRAELARHREWLEATNSSLSWRLTRPLRAARQRVRRAARPWTG
jgi:hypothetical protein